MLGWLLLSVLTALAAFAALGVTLRAEPAGRAEAGVLWTACFFALITAPILALGYLGQLRPPLIALGSLAASTVALALSARGRSLAAYAREIARAAGEMARLPRDAFRLAVEARSFALLGLACASAVIVISAWLTWLAPSESWDGFFYHEPIVAFALQNKGFGMVPLPPDMVVQATNGYPRLCEAFALWFVVFTDRSLIEIGNTLAAPGLLLAAYVIGRRYSADRAALLGWSAALLLMPAMLSQMRSSMIDVELAFFLVAAMGFATRPVLRVRDALAATLAMLLITGAKSSALTMVPPLMLVTYGRLLLAQGRARRGAVMAVIAGGSAAIVGMGALTFARNWLAFRNPVWPVTFSEPRLGIQWRGLVTLQKLTPSKSLGAMMLQKFGHPVPGIADILARDYGYGVPWVVLPLALVALIAALIVAIRRRRAGRPDAPTENLLLLAALGAALLAGTPNASSARYNVHLVAVLMVAIAWAAEKMREATRFHEGAMAGTLLLTLVPMVWTGWFFGVDGKGIAALLRRSHAERAGSYAGAFHLSPEVARARERELGPGDLVIFSQEMLFIGALWNDQLSNRVEYLERKDTHDFLDEIEKRHARWVVVGGPSAARAALMAPNSGWELVGAAGAQDKMVAFRRR